MSEFANLVPASKAVEPLVWVSAWELVQLTQEVILEIGAALFPGPLLVEMASEGLLVCAASEFWNFDLHDLSPGNEIEFGDGVERLAVPRKFWTNMHKGEVVLRQNSWKRGFFSYLFKLGGAIRQFKNTSDFRSEERTADDHKMLWINDAIFGISSLEQIPLYIQGFFDASSGLDLSFAKAAGRGSEAIRSQTATGRPAHRHGEPIARLTIRMMGETAQDLARCTAESAASELGAMYAAAGIPAAPENIRKFAADVLRVVREARSS